MTRPLSILALSTEFKGVPFLREAKRLGCQLTLITSDPYRDAAWPHEVLDAFHVMPSLRNTRDTIMAVCYLARNQRFDYIVSLDDYDVLTVADVCEHMRLPTMGHTVARRFNDKLAMRTEAKRHEIPVPRFVSAINNQEVADFIQQVPAPWVFKPRNEAGSEGVRKIDNADLLWQWLDQLGDQRSFYLLEEFLPGSVFHVDSLLWQGKIIHALASGYGAPPMAMLQGRQIFSTRILPRQGNQAKQLLALNDKLLTDFAMPFGVTHAEYICDQEGRFHFLEIGARVGGGHIDKMLEAASGLSYWQETARMVVAAAQGKDYQLPPIRKAYGGLIACPSRIANADMHQYTESEVVATPSNEEFAALVIGAERYERIDELLTEYAQRMARDFM